MIYKISDNVDVHVEGKIIAASLGFNNEISYTIQDNNGKIIIAMESQIERIEDNDNNYSNCNNPNKNNSR